MNVLVTGGAGFIGTNLIKRLIRDGHNVVSIDNYSTGLKSNHQAGCTYVNQDIRRIDDYAAWGEFDVVFHLAAIARIQPSFEDPENYFTTNANATLKLAKYCSQNNIPLIYAGSSSHHSGKFKNPYTFSKDIGEEIVKLFQTHYRLRVSIARFYNVYGDHQLLEGGYTTLIGRWINNIQRGEECVVYGDGEQRRDFTHIDDIVDALVSIIERDAYGYEFELGRGKNISVNEVAELFGIIPRYEDGKPGEARHTLNTSTTARDVLGWNPSRELVYYIKRKQW